VPIFIYRGAPFHDTLDAETRRSLDASRRVASADRESHELSALSPQPRD